MITNMINFDWLKPDGRCPKSTRKLAREKRKHKKLRRKQGRH